MAQFWFFAWNQRETYIADLQFLAFQTKVMQRLFRTTRGPALSVYEEWMLDRCFDVNPGSVVIVTERYNHIVVTGSNSNCRRFG